MLALESLDLVGLEAIGLGLKKLPLRGDRFGAGFVPNASSSVASMRIGARGPLPMRTPRRSPEAILSRAVRSL
jgi:hypothetical protein